MTEKRERFVREYLIDANATQAAVRAGYSERSAQVEGSRLLLNAEVRAALAKAKQALAIRNDLSADWVIERLRENVARAMQVEAVRDREGNETGEYVYEGAVANKALELLGKHIGMFVERSEVRVENMTPEDRTNRIAAILNGARERTRATN